MPPLLPLLRSEWCVLSAGRNIFIRHILSIILPLRATTIGFRLFIPCSTANLWAGRCAWVKGEEGHDKIGQAHFRTVSQISASEPYQLVPGGDNCVTISITGQSFMVWLLLSGSIGSVQFGNMEGSDTRLSTHGTFRSHRDLSSTSVMRVQFKSEEQNIQASSCSLS